MRSAHGAVFQHLDDTGTTVSVLAERAQMTKQAMAELVRHLEVHGYVTRVTDPADRRAKLVIPTDRGHEVITIAQELVPELERGSASVLGADRAAALRSDLEAIRTARHSVSPPVYLGSASVSQYTREPVTVPSDAWVGPWRPTRRSVAGRGR